MGGRVCYEWKNQPQTIMIEGIEYKFKSKIEMRWAFYLQKLKELDAIIFWGYETRTFQFKERYRMKRQYTLDFEVREKAPYDKIVTTFHEVKTSLRQTDIRRFRYMSADYEDIAMVLVLPTCSKNSTQARLRGNALRYVERIVYCQPLFKKWNIK